MNKKFLLPAIIILAGLITTVYTFDPKPDMNGDNIYYYSFAKSLISGKGYCIQFSPQQQPSSEFPPGYPILMAGLMVFSDAIAFHNYFGDILLVISSVFFFLFLVRNKFNPAIALLLSLAILINSNLLLLSTSMMSEAPFVFFTSLFLLTVNSYVNSPTKKQETLYLILAAFIAVYLYYIRSQGIILMLSFLIFLLFRKNIKAILITLVAYAAGLFPWILRNKLQGLSANRYYDQIFVRNAAEPGTGPISMAELLERIPRQFQELIFKHFSPSVFPYFNAEQNPDTDYTLSGIILLAIILTGAWQFKKFRFLLVPFILGNFMLISIWSAPSGGRYLTCFIPVLLMALLNGLYFFSQKLLAVLKIKKVYPAIGYAFCGFFFLASFKSIKYLNEKANEEFPIQFQRFQEIADYARENLPQDAIYCSRKPELFYIMSQKKGFKFLENASEKDFFSCLISNRTDYVILDQLGFSSTYKFLYPMINKYPQMFSMIYSTPSPEFYLFKFNTDLAKSTFKIP